jgi:hypothetical protein
MYQIKGSTFNRRKDIKRNELNFGQAAETPFGKDNLVKLFGYSGLNDNANKLISENIIPMEISEENIYVQQIVTKRSEGKLVEVIDDITYYEFKTGLDKWREMTTTSRSGRHLSHYKLLTRLQILNNKEDKITFSEMILKTYFYIAITANKLGNPLPRTQITTCMIEKVVGVTRIDKLRVIQLYEANYNLILKIMWARKTELTAHTKKLLNEGQTGSRPDCRSIDVDLHVQICKTDKNTIGNN